MVRRLGLATINLYTKYEVSLLTHYEDMKGDEKCKNWGVLGGLGVTQGHWKHHRERMTFYSTLVETIRQSCTVFEL